MLKYGFMHLFYWKKYGNIYDKINEILNQFGIILLKTSSVFSYSTTDPSFKIIISSAIDKTAGL